MRVYVCACQVAPIAIDRTSGQVRDCVMCSEACGSMDGDGILEQCHEYVTT